MADNKVLKALFGTEKVLTVIPGTLTAVAVMLLSLLAARYLGEFFKAQLNLQKSPVSTFLLAIILGMLLRNNIPFPKIFEPGFKFCVAKVLRLGIIFLGIRLSILAIAKIGLVAVVVVIICITAGIVLASLYARIFGVSSRLGTLIAAGTAICGVSAIVATAPTIGAKEEETAYAISTITIFVFASISDGEPKNAVANGKMKLSNMSLAPSMSARVSESTVGLALSVYQMPLVPTLRAVAVISV